MQTLLNLLPNLTPEQHRELSTELHVVEQVSLAQSAYPGAPMPQEEAGSFNTSDCDKVAKAVDKLCTECWDRIQAATGRIVPFEKG